VRIIATYNIKGGVGKTATAVNLAHRAAATGARVLVWDLDPQGAATFYFRVKPKVKGGGRAIVRGRRRLEDVVKGTDYEGLDLVPADFSYRNLDLELDAAKKPTRRLARVLKPIASHYDYVFLDCPPSISLASESVFEAAHVLLVPIIPTTLSLRTFEQIHVFLAANEWRRPPGVLGFFSMVDNRKRLHRDLIAATTAERDDVLSARIPSASDIERMGVHRAPVGAFAARSRSTTAYRGLWAELLTRI
jgi:cellulose biosynthesis protein BcsQ